MSFKNNFIFIILVVTINSPSPPLQDIDKWRALIEVRLDSIHILAMF